MNETAPQQQPQKKKGLSPWAWVAIGCLGLVIIGAVLMTTCTYFVAKKAKDVAENFAENPARAAAEMMVRANPDLELVESDDDAGTLTIRNKETGEVATFDWSEIEQGRFRFESDEGEMTFGVSPDEEGGVVVETDSAEGEAGARQQVTLGGGSQVPDWIPLPAGASTPQSTYATRGPQGASGMFTFTTSEGLDAVLEFFEQRLKADGYEVQVQTISLGDMEPQGVITATHEESKRSVNVTASPEEGRIQAMVQYSEGI